MREVDLLRLDARQRALWETALTKPPLFSDRASGTDMMLCALGGVVGLLVLGVALVTRRHGIGLLHSDLVARAAVSSAGFVLLALSVRAARWTRQLERAPWPCGRFLFPWGYAEVSPTHVRFVPGDELTVHVDLVHPRMSNASLITVCLSAANGWSAELDALGTELDVPRDAIDALPRTRLDHAEGYRTSARVVPPSDPARRLPRRLTGALATIAISALVGAALPPVILSTRAMVEAKSSTITPQVAAQYPFPWVIWREAAVRPEVMEAARTRIRRYTRPPFREALELVVDDPSPHVYRMIDGCNATPEDISQLNGFALAQAGTRPVEYLGRAFGQMNPDFSDLFAIDRPRGPVAAGAARFDSYCRWDPVGLTETTPTRATFRLRALWVLTVGDRAEVQRGVDIEPDVIAEVIRCSGDDSPEAPAIAAAGLVRFVMHADIFTDGVPGHADADRFWVSDPPAPCVASIGQRLEARNVHSTATASRAMLERWTDGQL